ncbi:MAG TPA: sodium:proton antiporter NhaD [Croceibacterium sp.]|nr:sodium:proton antiporter NhaD [Croceibacterium sp.]
MTAVLILVFVLAYGAIALEGPLKINKSAAALMGAGLMWIIYAAAKGNSLRVNQELDRSLIDTAQIAFFLIGVMTVVEVVDAHDGFAVITSRLRTRTLATLTIFITFVTFALSAVLANMTVAIVMVSLARRLVREQPDRLMLAGMIVIAANAGGAWSPIGDVTTTMLWIGGQVTAGSIAAKLILPSLVNVLVPLAIIVPGLRGKPILAPERSGGGLEPPSVTTPFERNLMFVLGIVALLSVPLFKAVTGLPPFLGTLFALGIVWAVGDLVHRGKAHEERERITIVDALTRIDLAAIVFFIGILLAVATLQHAGVLADIARWLDAEIGRTDVIVFLFGLLSSIVDNVPMVAAAMGMYDIGSYPPDSFLWEFMAYCTGTGGSILIIGSAAGVAAMGAEKIDFIWYLQRFALLALAGYIAGALVYIVQNELLA